jgi:hypothetical protein
LNIEAFCTLGIPSDFAVLISPDTAMGSGFILLHLESSIDAARLAVRRHFQKVSSRFQQAAPGRWLDS